MSLHIFPVSLHVSLHHPYTIPTRLPTRLLVHVRVSPELYGTSPLPEIECILSLCEAYSEIAFPETNRLHNALGFIRAPARTLS